MSKKTNINRIHELSEKWLSGKITAAEQQEYDLWYNSFHDQDVTTFTEMELDEIGNRIYASVKEEVGVKGSYFNNPRKGLFLKLSLLAASLLLFMLFFSYYDEQKTRQLVHSEELFYQDIQPGKDRATLNLEDGEVFYLDSLATGEIFQNAGVKIEKEETGTLVYSIVDDQVNGNINNTVSTPNGGQYKIILSDGTSVWLNAASQLSFPTKFTENLREVKLIGEAYFEVTHDQKAPFIVKTESEQVRVLGTKFNVKSYKSELSSISLVKGSVLVSIPSQNQRVLKPGEQSIIIDGQIEVHPFDSEEALAWKNGEFMFNNENMKSVMQTVARWYDVEIVVSPEVEDISIWGSVSRFEKINEVLKVIEMASSVHFKIEGRRIHVMK